VAAAGFIGRAAYLRELDSRLAIAARSGGDFVLLRGRRQIGKSRLVTEFLARSAVRAVYFQAARRPIADELTAFTDAIARSNLAGADLVRDGLRFATWEAAFAWIAGGATSDAPVVVVLDELPYLTGSDTAFESILQRIWDQTLQGRPVLLVVVGSDLVTMEAMGSYDRPLYGRLGLERAVLPLDVAEVAQVLGLAAPEAVDAYLTVGGFPRVLLSWEKEVPRADFLRRSLSDSTSALVVIGERMLTAEFRAPETARAALEAIGHGERTFGALSGRSGLSAASLNRALGGLREKQVIDIENPLSTARGGRSTRYRVADPYLRFWLRFVGPSLPDVERGRGDIAFDRTMNGWPGFRGRAVEPLVRRALERLVPLPELGEARDFGGYWTRSNDVEVDLVGVARRADVQRVAVVGSVKWRDGAPFTGTDEVELRQAASRVPGTDMATALAAVSRSGFVPGLEGVVQFGPDDVLRAWSVAP
jgi:uncharacterized protein